MDLGAARPFAGGDEQARQQRAQDDSGAGPEPSLLDRVADEEKAAKGECYAPDPDHPLGAEALLQADMRLGRRRGSFRRDPRLRLMRRLFAFTRGFGLRPRKTDGHRRRGQLVQHRRRLVRGEAGEARFDTGQPKFEALQALPRPHREHDGDDGRDRNGESEQYQQSEHGCAPSIILLRRGGC